MANYPFKINIQTKNGTQLSYYSSSFATSAATNVSASAIVDSINALPRAQYTQSEAVPNSGGFLSNYSTAGATGGKTYLSASHDGPQSGSITFTDTEDSATNGGLDFYTFWGTKVCSVLGLPEGIPIYTENFKFSDNANDTTNYISGDVIADGITVKEGFKLSTQARVRGNLIFDDVFGEGFVQFVSGSVTKMTVGYNDDKDFYKIGGDTNVQLSGSSAKITNIDNASGMISNVDLIRSNGLGGITLTGGTDGGGVANLRDYTRGELYLSHNFSTNTTSALNRSNIMVGQTAFRRQSDTTWASNLTIHDYNLILQNDSNTQNAFAGIAFHIENSVDGASQNGFGEVNNINAVIAALRANSTNGKTASDLIFATNEDDDSDLTERMRITYDGKVGIGNNSPSTTLDITGTLNVSSNITTGGTVDGIDIAGSLDQAVKTTSTPTFAAVTITGDIDLNGDLVGDDATDITNIESIYADHLRSDADGANNYINLDDNDFSFIINGNEVASFEDNTINLNDGGNDVDVRMEVSSGATATGMEDLDYAFHLDGGKGIAAFGDAAEDTFRGRVLQIFANVANGYAMWIKNDGDNANRQGLLIQCGAYSSGTGTLINFNDGDGHSVGTVTFSSGTVTYGTFTGVHDAYIMESDGVAENLPSSSLELYYESGTIVSMVSSSKDNTFQPVNFVASSSTYQDKRAYGVYMGSHEWADRDSDYHAELIDKHLIASVGDGFVLVNNQGGDIEIGDYITTASGSGGYGCKQSDDLLHNYTVAKATDGITWSNESTTYKLLACTYHCG